MIDSESTPSVFYEMVIGINSDIDLQVAVMVRLSVLL